MDQFNYKSFYNKQSMLQKEDRLLQQLGTALLGKLTTGFFSIFKKKEKHLDKKAVSSKEYEQLKLAILQEERQKKEEKHDDWLIPVAVVGLGIGFWVFKKSIGKKK